MFVDDMMDVDDALSCQEPFFRSPVCLVLVFVRVSWCDEEDSFLVEALEIP